MTRFVKRRAEGLIVSVSEPAPQWVSIAREGKEDFVRGLSIEEAEGLLYALQSALRDAERFRR